MLLLVLCACENNIDTVLRFVKPASNFHILHCFNELCNVTTYCITWALQKITVKKPWDVDCTSKNIITFTGRCCQKCWLQENSDWERCIISNVKY